MTSPYATKRGAEPWLWVAAAALVALGEFGASAQPAPHDNGDATVRCTSGGDPGSLGCHILADQDLGKAAGRRPLYWQIDKFRSEAAATAAAGPKDRILQVYDGVWLMSVAPIRRARKGGVRIASVGPLPVVSGVRYRAQYMSAAFDPGTRTFAHSHPGPEAWFVLEGSQCLETPEGATIVSAGKSGVVKGGTPMMLFSHGQATRRSLVLILHDATQPATIFATDWRPAGLCR
jgi:quercetin dioxygenase-like cupin family protein